MATNDSTNNSRRKEPRPRKPRKQANPVPTACMREINKLQHSVGFLIPRLPFSRIVREVLHDVSDEVYRVTPECLEALQESGEMFLTQMLEDAYRCTLHRQRVTLAPQDIQLVRYLRGRNDIGN